MADCDRALSRYRLRGDRREVGGLSKGFVSLVEPEYRVGVTATEYAARDGWLWER
jgi:hypothetical protein